MEENGRHMETNGRRVETGAEKRWYEMPSHQKSRRKRRFLPLAVLLVAVLACLPIGAYCLQGYGESDPEVETEEARDSGDKTEESRDEASPNTPAEPEDSWYADGTSLIPSQGEPRDLDAIVEEGMMNISISTRGEVEGKRAHLRIENKELNKVDQKVVIALAENDEPLFESGALAPGFALEEFELVRELPPGEHEALVTFTGYDRQTHAEKGRAGMKITLVAT